MSFPGKGDMSNQEAYEEICDKAAKYDKLKEGLKEIKKELEESNWEFVLNCGGLDILKYGVMNTIKKHTEGLI